MGEFGWIINGLDPSVNPFAHLGPLNKICLAHIQPNPYPTQPTHLMGYFMYVNGQNIQPTSKMRDMT